MKELTKEQIKNLSPEDQKLYKLLNQVLDKAKRLAEKGIVPDVGMEIDEPFIRWNEALVFDRQLSLQKPGN